MRAKIRLKHLCSTWGEYGLGIAAEQYVPSGIRLIRTSDITTDGRLAPADQAVFVEPDVATGLELRTGDLLISRSGTVGRSLVFDEELHGSCTFAAYLVRFRLKAGVDRRFIYYFTKSAPFAQQIDLDSTQATIANFNAGKLGNLQLPRLPTGEQTAVADFLDRETARIDGVIASKSRLTALLRERRQALADRATVPTFAAGSDRWPLAPLRKLATEGGLFTDGDWIETPYIQSDGIRLIQTGNIGVGVFKEKGFRYISDATFRELRCTEVLPGDVLISRLADPVGRACLAPDLGVRMVTAVDVCILRPSDSIDRRYLVAYLSSSAYLSFLDAMARGGTRERVSRDQLGQVPVPVPPLGEQKRIADDLERQSRVLDELEKRLNHQAAILREHRQALISAAVSGERGALEEAAR